MVLLNLPWYEIRIFSHYSPEKWWYHLKTTHKVEHFGMGIFLKIKTAWEVNLYCGKCVH